MNRDKLKRSRVPLSRPEGLEPRGLLAGGISSGLNLVMELGEVSRAAALKGVEVAAPIAAHGSITFEFEAGAAGDYLLEVRHVGEGLTLEATGPSGSASIDPGPAGPFSTIALPLKAADYQIKASAVGDQPVYVDWELLLTTGVGQSAAIGSTLVAPSVAVPLSGASGPVASSASTGASPSTSTSSASWGAAVSPSLVAAGGPVGRSDPAHSISPVGPISPGGKVALAHAGDGLPAAALKSLDPVAEEEVSTSPGSTPLLALEVLGDARQDVEALGTPTWLDGLARFEGWAKSGPIGDGSPGDQADRGRVEGVAVAVDASREPLDEESGGSMTKAASPGLIATGVLIASAARRWRAGRGLLPRGRATSKPAPFPPSMPRWRP